MDVNERSARAAFVPTCVAFFAACVLSPEDTFPLVNWVLVGAVFAGFYLNEYWREQ